MNKEQQEKAEDKWVRSRDTVHVEPAFTHTPNKVSFPPYRWAVLISANFYIPLFPKKGINQLYEYHVQVTAFRARKC